jgi:hypothetical protein
LVDWLLFDDLTNWSGTRSRRLGAFYAQADGQSAEAGHLQSELFEQLDEQERLVAARAEDRDSEPSGEALAALTPPFIEEPLAAAAALVEDVEGARARGWRGHHGLPATSAERALPAFVAAVRAGPNALVLVAAELADA